MIDVGLGRISLLLYFSSQRIWMSSFSEILFKANASAVPFQSLLRPLQAIAAMPHPNVHRMIFLVANITWPLHSKLFFIWIAIQKTRQYSAALHLHFKSCYKPHFQFRKKRIPARARKLEELVLEIGQRNPTPNVRILFQCARVPPYRQEVVWLPSS